jgi:hypothetical protein
VKPVLINGNIDWIIGEFVVLMDNVIILQYSLHFIPTEQQQSFNSYFGGREVAQAVNR